MKRRRWAQIRGKKILITAGPTWVPIDRVRVIANVSSGRTGIAIAQYAAKLGANVTLVLGTGSQCPSAVRSLPEGRAEPPRRGPAPCGAKRSLPEGDQRPGLKIIRFKYFDELQRLIRRQLRKKRYDIIIHGAAVSDYKPVRPFSKKLKSGKKKIALSLKPTAKIVDEMRRKGRGAFLVMFKLEAALPKDELVALAYKNMLRSKADMVVANNIDDITEKRHKAYIIDGDRKIIAVGTKEELARRLLGKIATMQRAR